ncbi:LysR family transcriptional regulator [Dactylosporangium sp. McL0621]|uniref:LysR family transcriptional regulator n=1 Tax=Dactylosporangium sp. McL0621 TaxID=3415678 RepID=UPI003CF69211
MDLRQLEYFVRVAEEANFTRAAAKAHATQPAVSAQIRSLERELGEVLFNRTKRNVRLTDAGVALLPYARAALGAVADARLAIDEIRGLLRGRISVGIMAPLPSIDIAGLLSTFHENHPAVQITLTEATSTQLLDFLHTGYVDAAIVGLPDTTLRGIDARVIHTESLVVVTSRTDPLAGRTNIHLDALRDRPLISLPKGSGLRAFLQAACDQAGFEPVFAFEATDPYLLVQLAARGLGVCVLPESIAKTYADQLHVMTITRPRLRGQIAFAWKSAGPHNAAARQFIRHAHRTFTTTKPQAGTDDAGQA